MKRIMLIFLVLLVGLAGLAGWLFFFERETVDQWMGKTPAVPAPAPSTRKASPKSPPTRKPVPTSKPEKVKLAMATVTIPNSNGSVFVNGVPARTGSQVQVAAGTMVIASYNDDGHFSHELLQGEAGGSYTPRLEPQETDAVAGWTTFQGNGARTGFVAARNRTALEPVWQIELNDKVECSPVLIGETAYLSTRKSLITAIDLNNGKLLWQKGVSGSAISPIATGAFIFAANNMGQFGGYRQENGKQKGELYLNSYPTGLALVSAEAFLVSTVENRVFSVKTKKSWRGKLPLKTNWEIEIPELAQGVGAPVIAAGAAVFQTESGLLAVELSSGKRLWPREVSHTQGQGMAGNMSLALRDESHFQTPTPAAMGNTIYAVLGKQLQAVDVRNGKVLWQRGLSHKATSSLSCAHGMLFFGTEQGKLEARSMRDGSPVFASDVSDLPVFASPVLFKDKLVAATGEGAVKLLHCFSGQVLAESKALAGAPINSTPAINNACILAVNSKGRMVCFK